MNWRKGLPEKSGEYVVITTYNTVETLCYSAKYKLFNVLDTHSFADAKAVELNKYVRKWVPLDEFLSECK